MISLLPTFSETIVTSLSSEQLTSLFFKATANTVQWDREYKLADGKIFYGFVYETHFQIALRQMRLFGFSPLIQGTIEPTHNGSILFLKYQLFLMTRVMLVFWTAFLFLALIIVAYYSHSLWYVAGLFSLLIFIHWVAWSNFKLQLGPSQDAIHQLLNRVN